MQHANRFDARVARQVEDLVNIERPHHRPTPAAPESTGNPFLLPAQMRLLDERVEGSSYGVEEPQAQLDIPSDT